MEEGFRPGPVVPTEADDSETRQSLSRRDPVTQSWLPDAASPPLHPPTEFVPPRAAAEAVPLSPPAGIARYGPGVPVTPPPDQAQWAVGQIVRTGRPPAPSRRSRRVRRLLGSALTVILLVASGVVLYLRFHHAPFHVTGVAISQQVRAGCGVDVTGRITTNGSAGTVAYQWLFQPDPQLPQPLSQSVSTGQRAVYVTVAVEGTNHGTASRRVVLQVLGPDPRTVSAAVVIKC
jgi:hypothetical protein